MSFKANYCTQTDAFQDIPLAFLRTEVLNLIYADTISGNLDVDRFTFRMGISCSFQPGTVFSLF